MEKAQYTSVTLNYSDLERIIIPRFQRGFVWNATKKKEFIQTLHHGFPFGSLLVYPESNEPDSRLQLLDGQQRLSTIKDYAENKLYYWRQINQQKFLEYFHNLNSYLGDECIDEQKFSKLVADSDFEIEWLDDLEKTTRVKCRSVIKEVNSAIDDYLDLSQISLPVIIFNGQKSQIAEVFANLNKGGIPLTKYEIFDAAWVSTEIVLPQEPVAQEILECLFSHYNDKELEAQFEFQGPTHDELMEERKITVSELCIALGLYVKKKLPALVSQNSSNVHAEIGYGILAMSQGVDNRKLDTLNTFETSIREHIIEILTKVDEISRHLQLVFEKILYRHSNSGNKYETGLSTTFKTLSYFAALWNITEGTADYQRTLNNIKVYYVYDFLRGVWGSHGDQRLADYYPQNASRHYKDPVSAETLKVEFSRWVDEARPGINFLSDVKALVAIHANLTYMSNFVHQGDPFELEHIVAKKWIDQVESDSGQRKILGSFLGNCMYLPKTKNNRKKDKTLYDFQVTNANGESVDLTEFMEKSHYFSQEEFKNIKDSLDNSNIDSVEVINSHIIQRANKVIDSLVSALTTSHL